MAIIRYDDIFSWEGWGGKFNLTSGRCRLRIYDLQEPGGQDTVFLKPIIVVVSNLPEGRGTRGVVSIRSCAGHIATQVTRRFQINPGRMLYIEYHPARKYGRPRVRTIPERYEAVDFKWCREKAFAVNWRELDSRTRELVEGLCKNN